MAQTVAGPVATGQPPDAPPVLVAGWDATNTRTLLTDTTGAIVLSGSPALPTTVYSNKVTVTTAGTRVALGSQAIGNSVVVKALVANTGVIYVGGSAVASTNGFRLSAGDAVSIVITNISAVFIDSAVDGEGVTYVAT